MGLLSHTRSQAPASYTRSDALVPKLRLGNAGPRSSASRVAFELAEDFKLGTLQIAKCKLRISESTLARPICNLQFAFCNSLSSTLPSAGFASGLITSATIRLGDFT
jgi:hypothetical protein